MNSQPNSIYLAYSQDAVRRLPTAIVSVLRRYGYQVYMDGNHFQRFAAPPQSVLDEINAHSHFVLLLTPASLCYGFNFGEKRLSGEIEYAKKIGRRVIVLLGYNLTENDPGWVEHSILPKGFYHLEMEGVNVAGLVEQLDKLLLNLATAQTRISHSASIEEWLIPTETQLQAEAILDKGLTEEYDSIFDNRRSKAVPFYNKALDMDPGYAEAYFQRANYYQQHIVHRYPAVVPPQILADYTTAICLNPHEARYYNQRAGLYERLNDNDSALADHTEAIRLAPREAEYYQRRGQFFLHVNSDFDRAIDDYTTAIQLAPGNASYYCYRGVIYARKKEFQSALVDISRAIELAPRNDNFIIFRWCIQIDAGLKEQTETDWQEAVNTSQSPENLCLRRAQIHQQRGEFQQALAAVEKALRYKPDLNDALELRERLLKRNS